MNIVRLQLRQREHNLAHVFEPVLLPLNVVLHVQGDAYADVINGLQFIFMQSVDGGIGVAVIGELFFDLVIAYLLIGLEFLVVILLIVEDSCSQVVPTVIYYLLLLECLQLGVNYLEAAELASL